MDLGCSVSEQFLCDKNKKRVCNDKRCDQKFDCEDHSDELTCCIFLNNLAVLNYVKSMKHKLSKKLEVTYSWFTSQPQNIRFHITLEDM